MSVETLHDGLWLPNYCRDNMSVSNHVVSLVILCITAFLNLMKQQSHVVTYINLICKAKLLWFIVSWFCKYCTFP